jgi:hypothetical protein
MRDRKVGGAGVGEVGEPAATTTKPVGKRTLVDGVGPGGAQPLPTVPVNTTVWPTTVGADQLMLLVPPVASFQVMVSVNAGPAVTFTQDSGMLSVAPPVAVEPITQVL